MATAKKEAFPLKTALIVGGVLAVAGTAYAIFGKDEIIEVGPPPPPPKPVEDMTDQEKSQLPVIGTTPTGQKIYWTPDVYVTDVANYLYGLNWNSYAEYVNQLAGFNKFQVDLVNDYWQHNYFKNDNETFKQFLLAEVDGADEYEPAIKKLEEYGY